MPDASKDAAKPADGVRDYKDTLFLPATDFPMRAGLPKAEPEYLKRWAAMGLYERLRESAKDRAKYVLHDGPPYANGHLHMGHAFNKILKDLVVRSRQMMGFDSNYVPGWDCHGLPIEWKVEEEFRARGKAKRDVPTAEFRKACRDYANSMAELEAILASSKAESRVGHASTRRDALDVRRGDDAHRDALDASRRFDGKRLKSSSR